ncbi:hypothetical protein [Streptomyces sp. NBC_01320]|uniref:hypothetical protein n=1 Tax=Streptomyces sp. NBC_01320 TaxID=2903824 RepID=UPI002E148998|nr:hypothetical protein OG395_06940 [Streptomyces sp. NBC_01320]
MGVWLLMPVTVDFATLGRAKDLKFHQNVTFGWVFYTWLFLLNGSAGIFLVHTCSRARRPQRREWCRPSWELWEGSA